MKKPLFLFLVSAFCALGSGAKADALDDEILRIMKKRQIAGLSLAVIQEGKIVKAKGYGVADRKSGAPVTTSTLFQAGSISKSVAAAGALRLADKGVFSLDKDINSYLKGWKVPENAYTQKKKVTLRGILSHTAGLTVHGFRGYSKTEALPSLVQILNGEKPANSEPIRVDFTPGSRWRYSGGGYTVMQQALLDITGKPFAEYMQETVLRPFGMKESAFDLPLPAEKAQKTATGYYAPEQPVAGGWHLYPEMAAAGLWTTASDLARFAIGIQKSLAKTANPVLSQEMTRQMLTVQKANDGLGVFLEGRGKTLRFSHGGRDEGFDAMLVAYAERGQGAVVMINANDNSNAKARILEAVAKAYHWENYPLLPVSKPIPDTEPQVTQLLQEVWMGFADGKADKERFEADFGDKVAAALKQGLAQFFQNAGALQTLELLERKEEGGKRTYRYRAKCKNGAYRLTCILDANNKILNLGVGEEDD